MPHPPAREMTARVPRRGWAWGDLAYPAALAAMMAVAPHAVARLVELASGLITAVGL